MERRGFLTGLASATLTDKLSAEGQTNSQVLDPSPVIERPGEGKPHAGKALALVTPHLDDGPIFAGGTLVKLLQEGYAGYFIRTSNDEKDSYKHTLGETVLANERDSKSFVRIAGLRQMFDLIARKLRQQQVHTKRGCNPLSLVSFASIRNRSTLISRSRATVLTL